MSHQTLRRGTVGLIGLSIMLFSSLAPSRQTVLHAYAVPANCLTCAQKGNSPVKMESDCKAAQASATPKVVTAKQDPPRKQRKESWSDWLRAMIL